MSADFRGDPTWVLYNSPVFANKFKPIGESSQRRLSLYWQCFEALATVFSIILLFPQNNQNHSSVVWCGKLAATFFPLVTVFWSTCHWVFNHSPVFADKPNPSRCFFGCESSKRHISLCWQFFEALAIGFSKIILRFFADKSNPSPCFLAPAVRSGIGSIKTVPI